MLVQVSQRLRDARAVVVLSGAGLSAESGIATFRGSQGGLWSDFDPARLATAEAWQADPALVWGWYVWRMAQVRRAVPHVGYRVLATLQERFHNLRCVTQNVDDLHERAGVKAVQHLHGSLFAPRCSACQQPSEFAGLPPVEPVASLAPPRCQHCQGFVRPGVVWFGESLPQGAWQRTEALMADCDVLLVVGTSGVVYPAAGLPAAARQAGKWVAEINPTPSQLSSHVHLHWQTTAAQGLGSLLETLTAQGAS